MYNDIAETLDFTCLHPHHVFYGVLSSTYFLQAFVSVGR